MKKQCTRYITAALVAFILVTTAALVTLTLVTATASGTAGDYIVVDLSSGPSAVRYPVSYLSDIPDGGWTDEHKTTKLVLRKIPAGTFAMGSPRDELRRSSNETQHQVTLTQDFHIGVFQVTQKQYERVMGTDPSYYKGDARPVERVSYDMIRGAVADGIDWPDTGSRVKADTFLGRIRAKAGLVFDLPTEAQWEYACRAGTTTALNSGRNLTATTGTCPNMAEVGRHFDNSGYNSRYPSDGKGGYKYHTKVGMYQPNNWGLYDMHGNVWEWCLDWGIGVYGASTLTDPRGPAASRSRILRGGGYDTSDCRSARRNCNISDDIAWYYHSHDSHADGGRRPVADADGCIGFRVCVLPVPLRMMK